MLCPCWAGRFTISKPRWFSWSPFGVRLLATQKRRTLSSNHSRSATLAEATYSPRKFLGNLSPITAANSHLNFGLLLDRACSLFSERPIYLRSSALRGFDTVLEILTFRSTYEFQRKEVLRLLSERREHPIPIRHIELRIFPSHPGIPACGECGCSGAEKPAVSGLLLLSICLSVVVPDLPAPSGLTVAHNAWPTRKSLTATF
jgi:hypothetical protein